MSATFWNMRRRQAAMKAEQTKAVETTVETVEKPVSKKAKGKVEKDAE